MTELRKQINNIVEDYNACKILAESMNFTEVYEGTTATAEDIALGKTAYSNGKLLEGTMVAKNSITVSNTEPVGEDRLKIWVNTCKNLADLNYFKSGLAPNGESSRVSSSLTGTRVTVKTYYLNPFTAIYFRTIDLTGLENQEISFSAEVVEGTAPAGRAGLATCDINYGNRVSKVYTEDLTTDSGRFNLKITVPDVIDDTNRYLLVMLYGTGSSTPTVVNAYTTYDNIQIEIGEPSTYEAYHDQQLYVLNENDEYAIFDKNTKF